MEKDETSKATKLYIYVVEIDMPPFAGQGEKRILLKKIGVTV